MTDDVKSDGAMLAFAHLNGMVDAGGIAIVSVKDGKLFMFSAEKLQMLLDAAESSPEKRAIVFVKMSDQLLRAQ